MEDTLNTVHEITKLIKKSPKHQTISQKFKDDVAVGSSGIRIFCPTRWTVRAEALASIADHYNSLMQTWDAAKDATRDTEMKARIGGVTAQMESFDFIFGVELGQKLLNMVDNLSCSLQSTRHSACEGQRIVQTTKLIFQSIRSSGTTLKPEGFQLMCQIPPFHIVEMFHLVLKQAIDLITTAIANRFDQKGFQMLQKLEMVLTTNTTESIELEEAIKEITSFYGAAHLNSDCL
ncbi:hypothetical protein EMCRGX_G031137 [Ephydatia muelleri]